MQTKQCHKCGKIKSLKEFNKGDCRSQILKRNKKNDKLI